MPFGHLFLSRNSESLPVHGGEPPRGCERERSIDSPTLCERDGGTAEIERASDTAVAKGEMACVGGSIPD